MGFSASAWLYPVDVISIVTRLHVGYDRLPTPVGASYFSLLRNVQTSFGAHPSSYSKGTGLLSLWEGEGELPELTNNHAPHSSVDVKNEWRYLSAPPYAFVA